MSTEDYMKAHNLTSNDVINIYPALESTQIQSDDEGICCEIKPAPVVKSNTFVNENGELINTGTKLAAGCFMFFNNPFKCILLATNPATQKQPLN